MKYTHILAAATTLGVVGLILSHQAQAQTAYGNLPEHLKKPISLDFWHYQEPVFFFPPGPVFSLPEVHYEPCADGTFSPITYTPYGTIGGCNLKKR